MAIRKQRERFRWSTKGGVEGGNQNTTILRPKGKEIPWAVVQAVVAIFEQKGCKEVCTQKASECKGGETLKKKGQEKIRKAPFRKRGWVDKWGAPFLTALKYMEKKLWGPLLNLRQWWTFSERKKGGLKSSLFLGRRLSRTTLDEKECCRWKEKKF